MACKNQAKLSKMFIYTSKIVPCNPQTNESNFKQIDLWQISHANGNTKISSVETFSNPTVLTLTLTQPKM